MGKTFKIFIVFMLLSGLALRCYDTFGYVMEQKKKLNAQSCYKNSDDTLVSLGNSCISGADECNANGCPDGSHTHTN